MKTAAAITAALVGSAAAFAPAQTGKSPTALKASIPEGYEDLVGIDVETGNKFVSLVPRVVRGGGEANTWHKAFARRRPTLKRITNPEDPRRERDVFMLWL